MDYRDNLEIDLIDLAKHILSKWVILVVCMVVCGVIAGAVGYYKSGKVVSGSTGEVVSEDEVDIDALRNKLTAESAELVELISGQYKKYMDGYRGYVDYGNTSIVMQLDANNVSKYTRLYAIDEELNSSKQVEVGTDFDRERGETLTNVFLSDSSNIISVYTSELLRDETINDIKKALDLEIDNAYVKELIKIEKQGVSILSVSCYGKDEASCKKIMGILDKNITSSTDKIQNIYDYNIDMIDEFYTEGPDEYVLNIQNTNTSNMNSMRSGIVGLTSSMSAEEKEYYNALIASLNNSDDGNSKETADSESNSSVQDTVVVRSINKKFILLGLVGGLFLAAFLYTLKYILSGKLHTADDLRSAFRLSVIGEVSENDDFGLVSQGAALAASKLSSDKIYVMGASDDEVAVKVRNAVCKEIIEKHGIKNTKAGSSAVNDAVSMQSLSEADAVVFVERIDKSGFDDIAKEIELCKKFEVKILGAVVVK